MARTWTLQTCLAVLACTVAGLGGANVAHGAKSPAAGTVYALTDASFEADVFGKEAGSWVVEFAQSKEAAREDELGQIAAALSGTGIKVGVVDASVDKTCSAGKMGLKLFGPDKAKKVPKSLATSSGKIDVQAVLKKVLTEVQSVVFSRVSSPSSGSGASGKQQRPKGKPMKLDDDNFDDVVMKSDEAFMVAFVAPWCGHCKALAPEFQQAAEQLEGTGVVVAEVDATANERLAQRFGIQGFPTIKFFLPGVLNKDDRSAVDYQLERSAQAITTWALSEFERHGGKVTIEIPEITSQGAFDELCEDSKCVLVFLPDLLDSGKAGRDAYIEHITEAQRNARHLKFGWLAAGSQPEWEAAYSLGFGFPAVLFLRKHQSKELGLIMRGSNKMDASSLAAFASSPKSLGEFSEAGWPAFATAEPWDGEEAPPPPAEDDDFDLDDFLNED